MLVFGKNVLKEIDKKKIRKVYINKNIKDVKIIEYVKNNQLRYTLVDTRELDRLSHDGVHQGVVVEINDYEYQKLDVCFKDEFVVILDHLEDPHNFGAIIRTCEAAGIQSIIIPKDRSVRVNDTVMKTSVGTVENVNIIEVSNIRDAIKKLQKENFFIYATAMDGEDYHNVDFSGKKALVIGNEGKGISKIVFDESDFIIKIPMKGNVNSLNASVAAAVLIFNMI